MKKLRCILLLVLLLLLAAPSCNSAPVSNPAGENLTIPLSMPAPPTAAVTATPAALLDTVTPAVPTAAASAAPSLTPTLTLPEEHFIASITGHKQYFTLGCETAAAKDWANYFGMDFSEFEFQYKLPLSDNPDFGFVGDVNAPWGQVPPYGYGVYAGPVAELLNTYGIPARAYKGYTLAQLTAQIAADKPVIVWVIGNVVGGIASQYTDSQGRQVTVAAYEHVVIVTGYNQKKLRYMTNGKFYETPREVFLNSWGVLGNMVIVNP